MEDLHPERPGRPRGFRWYFRLGFRSERYSIELGSDGLRVPTENRWVPWSQVRGLRERFFLQRVDLLDHSGARIASLEYQLEEFSQALRQVMRALQMSFPEQDTFRYGLATVSITDAGVSTRGGLKRARFYPWSEIVAVEIDLWNVGRGMFALGLFLIDSSGARQMLESARVDPFHLAARIERRLAARAGKVGG